MASLFSALTGKRTYLIALLAIGYLIYCQATHQKPDETILGIFGAMGLAMLRASMKGAVVQALNDEIDQPPAAAPASNPGGNGGLHGGIPLLVLALVSATLLIGTAGCTTRTIEFGGAKYTSRRLGVAEQFGKIEVRQGTNSLTVDGVQSDLVTGMKVGAETALKAAAALRP